MSGLLLLLVAGVNFFCGLAVGEYVRKFLKENPSNEGSEE